MFHKQPEKNRDIFVKFCVKHRLAVMHMCCGKIMYAMCSIGAH